MIVFLSVCVRMHQDARRFARLLQLTHPSPFLRDCHQPSEIIVRKQPLFDCRFITFDIAINKTINIFCKVLYTHPHSPILLFILSQPQQLVSMKLTLALNCAVALGLMGSSCSAFTAPGAFLRKSTKIHTGSGWDNDDFLDSLSNPSETAPLADDFEPPQGTMPPVTPQKGGEGEESQGGTRFKEMMSKAQDGAPNYPPPINPYANVIPSSPNQSEQPEQPLANMENMSVEDQAALFRQMMSMQQQGNGSDGQQHEVPAAKPKSFGPMGLDAKGRKIGRNRDADTIANTSDLYFAQLKRDSAVRTVARYSGDEEFAEKIFEDEAIHELEATYQVNPYLAA